MGKKVISFSVYGKIPVYHLGAEKNVEEAKIYYPDWICRFYCTQEVPNLDVLTKLDCEVVLLSSPSPPIFWRIFACDDPEVDACIIRDTDSIVNPREKAAVDEWIESDKTFHMMHDEKRGHFHKVMAGMWGVKKTDKVNFTEEIAKFCKKRGYKEFSGKESKSWGSGVAKYFDDQYFLSDQIFPKFEGDYMEHGNENPFPGHEPMKYGSFVGERIGTSHMMGDKLFKRNKSSKKVFVHPHQSSGDIKSISLILEELCAKYSTVVIALKHQHKNLFVEKFSELDNLSAVYFGKDQGEAVQIFEDKYSDHRYAGLGMHGEEYKGGFGDKVCRKQLGAIL